MHRHGVMRMGWPPLNDCVLCHEPVEPGADMCPPCREWDTCWRAMTPEQREAEDYHGTTGGREPIT